MLPIPVPDLGRREEAVREQLLEMRAELDRAIEQGLEPAELAGHFTTAGMHYHANALHQAAAACYRNAKRLSPSDYRIPYLLGQVLRVEGDAEGAIRELKVSLDLNAGYLATYVVVSEVLLDENRAGEAEPFLDHALGLAPESARVHIGLGRIASQREEFNDAVEYLETALRLAPQATVIHYPLGLAYRGKGDLERARTYLQQRGNVAAPLDDPLMAELRQLGGGSQWHAKRGLAAFQAGSYNEAVREFRTALDSEPKNSTARLNLAAALLQLGDVEGALEQFRETLRIDPTQARAHFGIGTLLARQGRDAEAAESYESALAVDAGLLDAHFNLANALRRLGRFEQAETHFRRVVESDPRNGPARYALALTLTRLERWVEALACLEAGHEAMPDSRPLKNALARVLATAPVDSLRDGPRALQMAQELYAEETSVYYVETIAMAQAENGYYYDALHTQERALAAVVNAGRPNLTRRIETNLALYRAAKPCRTPGLEDDSTLSR